MCALINDRGRGNIKVKSYLLSKVPSSCRFWSLRRGPSAASSFFFFFVIYYGERKGKTTTTKSHKLNLAPQKGVLVSRLVRAGNCIFHHSLTHFSTFTHDCERPFSVSNVQPNPHTFKTLAVGLHAPQTIIPNNNVVDFAHFFLCSDDDGEACWLILLSSSSFPSVGCGYQTVVVGRMRLQATSYTPCHRIVENEYFYHRGGDLILIIGASDKQTCCCWFNLSNLSNLTAHIIWAFHAHRPSLALALSSTNFSFSHCVSLLSGEALFVCIICTCDFSLGSRRQLLHCIACNNRRQVCVICRRDKIRYICHRRPSFC